MGLLDVELLSSHGTVTQCCSRLDTDWTLTGVTGDWSLQWLHVYPLHNAASTLGSVVKVVGVADCCVAGPGPGSVELWSWAVLYWWRNASSSLAKDSPSHSTTSYHTL